MPRCFPKRGEGEPAASTQWWVLLVQLLLDSSLCALVDSGQTRKGVQLAQMGVFTGSSPGDFLLRNAGFNVARAVASALRWLSLIHI